MPRLEQTSVYQTCPYCGENIEWLIDCSLDQQSYVEDCEVCCQPVVIDVVLNQQGEPVVTLSQENN